MRRAIASLVVLLAACGRIGFSADADPGDVAPSRYAAAVLVDQPIGYWRLGDATATALDTSGHGRTGATAGGCGLGGSAGLLADDADTAAAFDGTSGHVVVPDEPALQLTSAVTLEAWISAASFDHPTGAPYARVLHKGPTGNTGYALMAFQDGTANQAHLRVELDGLTVAGLDGATLLLPNTTYHVAATWDGATLRVYVDGEPDGVVAATGTIPVSTAPLEIGRRRDGLRYWAGTIDEVAVYGSALSAAQLAAHHDAGR